MLFLNTPNQQACPGAGAHPLDQAWSPPALLSEWLPAPSLAALLLQNADTVSNARRRQYIAEGLYVDPFEEPQKLLARLYTQASGWGAAGQGREGRACATY